LYGDDAKVQPPDSKCQQVEIEGCLLIVRIRESAGCRARGLLVVYYCVVMFCVYFGNENCFADSGSLYFSSFGSNSFGWWLTLPARMMLARSGWPMIFSDW